jgi:hypothetical protein
MMGDPAPYLRVQGTKSTQGDRAWKLSGQLLCMTTLAAACSSEHERDDGMSRKVKAGRRVLSQFESGEKNIQPLAAFRCKDKLRFTFALKRGRVL